jgi:hypothetical protein
MSTDSDPQTTQVPETTNKPWKRRVDSVLEGEGVRGGPIPTRGQTLLYCSRYVFFVLGRKERAKTDFIELPQIISRKLS